MSADSIRGTDWLSTKWKGFAGPVVQVSLESGDTSGRFGVARMIARVFPSHQEFVRSVIEERIEPASSFPSGPYPTDKLTHKSPEIVEYETPPQTEGLGTKSRLQPNADPIRGVVILVGETPELLHLSVRLPQDLTDLAFTIIRQVERDAEKPLR